MDPESISVNIDLTKVKTEKTKSLEAYPLVTTKDCIDMLSKCYELKKSGRKEAAVKAALTDTIHPWLVHQIGIHYRSNIKPQDYELYVPSLIKQHEEWMQLHPNNGPIPKDFKKKKHCYDCGTELVFYCPKCKATKS